MPVRSLGSSVLRWPSREEVEEALKAMAGVPGLLEAARALAEGEAPEVLLSAGEFVLEGLVGRRKLSRGEATYQAAERPRSYGN